MAVRSRCSLCKNEDRETVVKCDACGRELVAGSFRPEGWMRANLTRHDGTGATIDVCPDCGDALDKMVKAMEALR